MLFPCVWRIHWYGFHPFKFIRACLWPSITSALGGMYPMCPWGRCIWLGLGGLFCICQVELVYSFVQLFCFLVDRLLGGSIDYGK